MTCLAFQQRGNRAPQGARPNSVTFDFRHARFLSHLIRPQWSLGIDVHLGVVGSSFAGSAALARCSGLPEWDAGHIEGANWWPLDNFRVAPPEMDHEAPVAVHCKGGYRSMIASSLLQRAGFKNVINVVGGLDAWQQAKLPTVSGKPVGV